MGAGGDTGCGTEAGGHMGREVRSLEGALGSSVAWMGQDMRPWDGTRHRALGWARILSSMDGDKIWVLGTGTKWDGAKM